MGSDELGLSGRCFFSAHLRTRPLHGLDDIVITGATAQITGDAPTDLILCRVVVVFEEFHATHDHARRAEAAMQPMVFLEPFLEWMERTTLGSQPLDGSDAVPVGLNGQHGAALDALAVQQNSTGATTAGIASDVGAGHVEDLADHVYEEKPGFYFQLMLCTVDGD